MLMPPIAQGKSSANVGSNEISRDDVVRSAGAVEKDSTLHSHRISFEPRGRGPSPGTKHHFRKPAPAGDINANEVTNKNGLRLAPCGRLERCQTKAGFATNLNRRRWSRM